MSRRKVAPTLSDSVRSGCMDCSGTGKPCRTCAACAVELRALLAVARAAGRVMPHGLVSPGMTTDEAHLCRALARLHRDAEGRPASRGEGG